METIEFIREHGVDALNELFGIRVKRDSGLLVLNYDQIDSPKTHPIVKECRSLILREDNLEVVSRSFDRFFNLGEGGVSDVDWENAEVFEKIDGSLIKIYWNPLERKWRVATRGTAFAESDCMGHGITFEQLVHKAIGVSDGEEFDELMTKMIMNRDVTYIFELTCIENRVVRHYTGYNMYFLGARHNATGDYVCQEEKHWIHCTPYNYRSWVKYPESYKFNSAEDCVRMASELKNLDEGYVVYVDGVPVCKVKSPAYVAVHHIRGEGLNPKRISELVVSGEVDEYLTYFPEDSPAIQPYVDAFNTLKDDMAYTLEAASKFEIQKDFALAIAPYKFKSVLFNARAKGIDVIESFNQQRLNARVDLIQEYKNRMFK